MSACFHAFGRDVAPAEWPVRFNCPFCYEPHPLCREAARAVGDYLRIYCDAYGTYSAMPWLIARYTYQ